MPRITKRRVEGAEPRLKDYLIWDDQLRGFALRIKPSGVRSYLVQYRNQYGRSKRLTIGKHGQITAEQARKEARHILADAVRGGDAALDRKKLLSAPTMAKLCERFLEEHAEEHKKRLSVEGDRRNIRNHIIPILGQLRVEEVSRPDIDRLKRSVKAGQTSRKGGLAKGGPIAANRCLALLSKMFNMAERWGLRPDGSNPCRHVAKYPEQRRERFLSEAELARLADVLADSERTRSEPPSAIAAVRLLLFTGARLSEILTLTWRDVDIGNQCLHIPDSKTGPKRVFLPPAALEVLADLDRQRSPGNSFVIAGAKPETHLVNLQKPWRRIRARAGLQDVRLHDLRHSFASMAVAGGLSLPMIGALLGHSQPATTARYAHLADDPLKQAANLTGARIAAAMKHGGGKKSRIDSAS